jgi:hypothetical protein
MTAQAITGGPPPEGNFLQRLERAMREGSLPDPRSTKGLIIFGVFGLVLGFFLGVAS